MFALQVVATLLTNPPVLLDQNGFCRLKAICMQVEAATGFGSLLRTGL